MAKRLTAKQLGITSEERKALIKVRDGLADGKFVHRKHPLPDKPTDKPIFNMNAWRENWKCGTAGCIGGWMEVELAYEEGNWNYSKALDPLFQPFDLAYWSTLTPARAVRAIDNFLETGTDRPWARRKRAA